MFHKHHQVKKTLKIVGGTVAGSALGYITNGVPGAVIGGKIGHYFGSM